VQLNVTVNQPAILVAPTVTPGRGPRIRSRNYYHLRLNTPVSFFFPQLSSWAQKVQGVCVAATQIPVSCNRSNNENNRSEKF